MIKKRGSISYVDTAITMLVGIVLAAVVFAAALWIFSDPISRKMQTTFSEPTASSESFTDAEFAK